MTDSERAVRRSEEAASATVAKERDLPSIDSQEALRVGNLVLAIHVALEDPTAPDAMSSVVELGTDSRYYVLVRGWLSEQLKADQSIVDARRDDVPAKVSKRETFLKQAIRAIDLE